MLMLDGMPAVRVKAEPLESERRSPKVHSYPDMETVPLLLSKVKAEPPEDFLSSEQFHTQTEPVDLSINKTRSSPPSSTSSPITSAFSPLSSSSSSSSSPSVITTVSSGMSSVLTPGPLVASPPGVRNQPYLHIIHPVPPSSPNKLVQRIPVVVQSLPLMYTTAVRSSSNHLNSTIMVPLLDEIKSQGKGGEEEEEKHSLNNWVGRILKVGGSKSSKDYTQGASLKHRGNGVRLGWSHLSGAP